MGLYHTVVIAYGFPIPTTTDLDDIDRALQDQPNTPDNVGYTVVGDMDQLLLTTAYMRAEENDVIALAPDLFTRPEAPAWNTALHNAAARLGIADYPAPTWLLIHNYR